MIWIPIQPVPGRCPGSWPVHSPIVLAFTDKDAIAFKAPPLWHSPTKMRLPQSPSITCLGTVNRPEPQNARTIPVLITVESSFSSILAFEKHHLLRAEA